MHECVFNGNKDIGIGVDCNSDIVKNESDFLLVKNLGNDYYISVRV